MGRGKIAAWWSSPGFPRTPRPPLVSERSLGNLVRDLASAAGVVLDDAQVRQMVRYLDLVASWSRKARLTAVANPPSAARVHVADSLLCLRAGIPHLATVVDVGSGAGLPGIPLKIARPDLAVTLVEPSQRRAAFLEMACADLGLEVEVVARPAEEVGRDPRYREAFQVAVARAVAPMRALAELVLPLIRPGGKAVLLKGPAAGEEVERARTALSVLGGGTPALVPASIPGSPERVVVVVPKVAPTPSRYPRRPGVPRRRPLG